MPIPTITTVEPTTGPSMGGNLVFLTGTNFLLPTPNSPDDGVTLPLDPSVSITVGGVAVPWANILPASDTRIGFIAPKETILPSEVNSVVDITVTNLDSSGTPIPGETVTEVDAYTYVRPDLSHEARSDLTRVVLMLLTRLVSEVVQNTSHMEHPDYDEDTSTVYVDPARLPALLLIGPRTEKDGLYEEYSPIEESALPMVGEVFLQRPGRSLALTFDIVGIADKSVIALNLMSVFINWLERNTEIPFTDSLGHAQVLDMDFSPGGDPEMERGNSEDRNSGVAQWSAQITLRGFQETTLAGQELDQGVGITAPVDEDGVQLQDSLQLTDNSVGSRAPVSPSE